MPMHKVWTWLENSLPSNFQYWPFNATGIVTLKSRLLKGKWLFISTTTMQSLRLITSTAFKEIIIIRSKTHKIKRTLFNWTKQDEMRKFSRKSSFSSYIQHKNKTKKQLIQLILCQFDVGGWWKEKGTRLTDVIIRFVTPLAKCPKSNHYIDTHFHASNKNYSRKKEASKTKHTNMPMFCREIQAAMVICH